MPLLMVDVIVRAFVLLTLAWCAGWLLRRQPAALRASVWTAALAGVLLLPALTVITPDMRIPVWTTSAPTPLLQPVASEPQVDPIPQQSARPEPTSTAQPMATGDSVSQAVPVPVPGRDGRDVSIAEAAMLLWAIVMMALLVRLFVNHVSASRLSARWMSATPAWCQAVEHARLALGIRRRVHLHVSDDINVPVVTGVWRPVLHLPLEALQWNDGMRHAVALHELAHVSRWDGLSQLVSQLACAAYWFIPVVWIGARRAAALREQASDDLVVASGMGPTTYAEHLINVARATVGVSRPAALAMAHPSHIRERIVAILDPASPRSRVGRARLVVAVTGVAAVVLLASAVELTARAPAPVSVFESQRPTPPAPPTALLDFRGSGPCDRNVRQHSSSSSAEGERRRWTIQTVGPDCNIDLRMDGMVEFNREFTDVARISSDGLFRVEARIDGVRRELRIEPNGNGLTRVYRVDGAERPFDAQAQAWFGEFLIDLDRRTAIGVDVRVPRLLEQGGTAGVLAETGRMPSDYVRDRYYEKLAEAKTLTVDETAQVLDQVADRTRSDHYASAALSRTPGRYLSDARVRDAAFKVVDGMDSDHYVATSLQTVLGTGTPTSAEVDFLVRALADVSSDHYKHAVLTHMLRGTLETSHRTALAEAARQIRSGHYAAAFIDAVTAAPGASRLDHDSGDVAIHERDGVRSDVRATGGWSHHHGVMSTERPFIRSFVLEAWAIHRGCDSQLRAATRDSHSRRMWLTASSGIRPIVTLSADHAGSFARHSRPPSTMTGAPPAPRCQRSR